MTEAELDRGRRPDSAADLTRELRDEVSLPVESASLLEARRARLVPSIETMILRSGQERRLGNRRLLSWGAVAAAAAIALSIGATRLLRPGSAPVAHGAAESADAIERPDPGAPASGAAHVAPAESASSDAIASGSRVRTTNTESSLVLPDGARVSVAPQTTMELVEVSRTRSELLLESGRVELDVPRLDKGAELVVRTEVGSVVVHGTRFSVETGRRAEGAWMAVEVTEGEVAVLQDGIERARLRGGDAWRSSPAPIVVRPSGSSSSASSGAASDLGAQNQAYASAMRSKARGDDAATVKELGAFVHRWPDSPLAPEARAELARARKRLEHGQ